MNDTLLSVKNLKTVFKTDSGIAAAVDGVSFDIKKGEAFGLVGESGCGKSVTALSIMKLINMPQGNISEGEILFSGVDILKMSDEEVRKIRGNKISMIFQDPMTSLNPVYKCGDQITESIILHKKISKADAIKESIELLRQVGIDNPAQRINNYPHQLSGGMRQRIMIAMAIACDISLLIADEPTTALDVTVQAQVLELINKLRTEKKLSLLLITHDLGVVAETCERTAVMYAGKIQETSNTAELFNKPLHPYTIGLMESIPKFSEQKERLNSIKGNVPSIINYPKGCRFNPRCDKCFDKCTAIEPELKEVVAGHFVRCHLY